MWEFYKGFLNNVIFLETGKPINEESRKKASKFIKKLFKKINKGSEPQGRFLFALIAAIAGAAVGGGVAG